MPQPKQNFQLSFVIYILKKNVIILLKDLNVSLLGTSIKYSDCTLSVYEGSSTDLLVTLII